MAKSFFGDHGSHNMFLYQSTLDMLELKKVKTLIMLWVWRDYTLLNFRPYKLLYWFTIMQDNWATKIVNAWIVYDLDAWRRNPLDNFKLKNC